MLLRWLGGSGWGAGATTLWIAALALVYSTAEYCVPVWCHNAHTYLTDPAINNALQIVTGCLRPTPTDNLPTLTGIQPAELCRSGATLSLAHRAMEPGHLLHSALTRPPSTNARHLKSRHPFVPAAQHLIILSDNNNIRATEWADYQWNAEWTDSPRRLHIFIPNIGIHPLGMTLPRRAWVWLNHLRINVGCFCSCLYKWGTASFAACECGAEEQMSTMLSSNVQSIDLPMDCMAWWCWTMRQLNGCSTPAPRSSVAKQWFQQLAQKKKNSLSDYYTKETPKACRSIVAV